MSTKPQQKKRRAERALHERVAELYQLRTNLLGTEESHDPVAEVKPFPLPQNEHVKFHVRRLGCAGFRLRQQSFQRDILGKGKLVRDADGATTIDFSAVDMREVDPFRFLRDEEGIARELIEKIDGLEIDGKPVDYVGDFDNGVAGVLALFTLYDFLSKWVLDCATELEEEFQRFVGVAEKNSSDPLPTSTGEGTETQ